MPQNLESCRSAFLAPVLLSVLGTAGGRMMAIPLTGALGVEQDWSSNFLTRGEFGSPDEH